MQFPDFDKGIDSLIRYATFTLIVLAVFATANTLLMKLPPAAVLGLFCLLLAASPIAYLVYRNQEGPSRREGARRGAERTPLVPPAEEDE